MSKHPIRHRADCPGCGYAHYITLNHGAAHLIGWIVQPHNAPGGGLCSGSGSIAKAPVEPIKGPGPNTEGKVTVSDTGITFTAWPKLKRLTAAEFVASEKCDGTNAAVVLQPDPTGEHEYIFAAQSRTRLITPTSDNFGFAAWVYENVDSLFADLGYGLHFGEWYGAGIQRRYGLDHKRFMLFNHHRWSDKAGHFETPHVDVVPVLARGCSLDDVAEQAFDKLRDYGSQLVPGWKTPEGYVIYDVATGASWKVTDAVAGPGKHA